MDSFYADISTITLPGSRILQLPAYLPDGISVWPKEMNSCIVEMPNPTNVLDKKKEERQIDDKQSASSKSVLRRFLQRILSCVHEDWTK